MDYLGKGEVLTNTDLDRFVNNIWEKLALCVHGKSLRSLTSAHEKWGQKQKCCVYHFGQYIYIYIWRALFQNAINTKFKKKWVCHAVYWTYSLLHQCFMPNRYFSLFKMYLTLLTSQRGALATDAKSCSLWRSLLEHPPPAPETRVRDPLGVMVRTRGGLTIIV